MPSYIEIINQPSKQNQLPASTFTLPLTEQTLTDIFDDLQRKMQRRYLEVHQESEDEQGSEISSQMSKSTGGSFSNQDDEQQKKETQSLRARILGMLEKKIDFDDFDDSDEEDNYAESTTSNPQNPPNTHQDEEEETWYLETISAAIAHVVFMAFIWKLTSVAFVLMRIWVVDTCDAQVGCEGAAISSAVAGMVVWLGFWFDGDVEEDEEEDED